MSHTHQSPHSDRTEARVAEAHYIAYLPGADWWMALAVLIAIVPTAFPLPWWW